VICDDFATKDVFKMFSVPFDDSLKSFCGAVVFAVEVEGNIDV